MPLVKGIHRWPVVSSHKETITRKMLPFDEVIMQRDISHDYPGWQPMHQWDLAMGGTKPGVWQAHLYSNVYHFRLLIYQPDTLERYVRNNTPLSKLYICAYFYVTLFCYVNIWKVDCARATTFFIDTRTDGLVKVSSFWDQKKNMLMSDDCTYCVAEHLTVDKV